MRNLPILRAEWVWGWVVLLQQRLVDSCAKQHALEVLAFNLAPVQVMLCNLAARSSARAAGNT
jgi:hypothetical protein